MEPPDDGLPSERLAWWGSFLVCAAIGLVWAFSTPLMASPDESAHTLKAVAVADGQWTMATTTRIEPDGRKTPVTHIRVPQGYVDLGFGPTCYSSIPSQSASCAPETGSATNLVEWETYVATYPPTYYVLVGWPSRFLAPRPAMYAMRACSALLGGALLASALVSALAFRRSRSSSAPRSGATRVAAVGAAGVALSMTPIVMSLLGSINPNGTEIAAAICLWAAGLDLLGRRTGRVPTRLIVRVAVSGALLASMRPLSPPVLVCVLVGLAALAVDRQVLRSLAADRRVRWGAAGLGTALVVSTGIIVGAGSTSAVIKVPMDHDPGRVEVIRRSLGQLHYRVEQLIGILGNLDTRLPWPLDIGWLTAVVVLAAVAEVVGRWRDRLVLGALVIATLLMPTASESISGAEYGLLWQGRYTLPVAVSVPIAAAWIIDRRGLRSRTTSLVLALGGIAVLALGQVWAFATMLNRYAVGLPTSPLAFRRATGWNGPWPPLTMFMLMLLAVGAFAAWTAFLAVRPPPGATPGPPASADPKGTEELRFAHEVE